MAGFLQYGSDFSCDYYKGGDGLSHYEIVAVGGDFYTISNSSWDEIVKVCADYDVPVEIWPVYESCIDVPLDEVREKNRPLNQAIASLPDEIIRSNTWLEKIVSRIREGKLIVYCRV